MPSHAIKTLLLLLLTSSILLAQEVPDKLIDSVKVKKKALSASSTKGQIKADLALKGKLLQPYFRLKERLYKDYNLGFGVDYNTMLQGASSVITNDQQGALSGVFRIYASWDLVGKNSLNKGGLTAKVENRHAYGSNPTVKSFASNLGYVGFTNVVFSDAQWILANLFWEQDLFQDRLTLIGGIVDITDYVHVYGLSSPWSDFSNFVFGTGATIPTPSQGLGLAALLKLGKKGYVLGGIADTNGDPSKPQDAIDSFFKTSEFFYHAEIGFVESFDEFYNNNFNITYWYADRRELAQVDPGWGLAFSASWLTDTGWQPFLRAAWSNGGGGTYKRSAAFGTGYQLNEADDVVGIGISWGRPRVAPAELALEDQWTMEFFYRFQVDRYLTLTPDIQLLFDPALNPTTGFIAVAGIRGRIVL